MKVLFQLPYDMLCLHIIRHFQINGDAADFVCLTADGA
jgi:hypothetical protein